MTTNLIVLKTPEQFQAGWTPVYTPIYGLLMSRAVAHPIEVGELTLRTLTAIGDIRSERVSPKDTEIKQIAVGEQKKPFKKFYLQSQFIISQFQNAEGVDDVTAQVLDEHNRQYDEIAFGDGFNNGIYTSSDPYYILEGSTAIAGGGNDARLLDLHAKVMVDATKADRVAGRKTLIFFGDTMLPLVNGLYASGAAFRDSLQRALGADYNIINLPSDTNLDGGQGWMIVNLDQIKFHYTALPQLQKRGINEEKNYAWSNFLMGSNMTEVTAKGGIIRRPATLA